MSLPSDLVDVWEMRPKLRHDVVFLDAPNGAYLRGSDTAFLLKGKSAFRWLVTLNPYLTGEHSVARLCAELSEDQSRTVATLVRALVSRGFAKDVREQSPIPEVVGRHFANQIEFIDHFVDDAPGRFLRFRQTRVVLGGAGPMLLAAAIGLLRNGCASLDVHPEDDPASYRDAVQREVAALRADGLDVEVRINESPLEITDADAVIYCADSRQLPRVLELARRCHEQGPLFIPAVWDGDRAVLGPSTAGGAAGCWLCAQLRLNASAAPATAAQAWRHLAIGPVAAEETALDEVVAQMVGNAVAFELFRIRTGALPADTGFSVVILDGDTLESSRERLLRHPACPICGSVAVDDPGAPESTLTDEEIYQRAEVLVSPNAGVFTQFVDDPLEQAPLKTARLRVPAARGARELTTFDVNTVMAARLTAYRVAVRDYVGRLGVHPDAVVATAAQLSASGREPVPWTELATASGVLPYTEHRQLTWLPARVLGQSATVWVPAAMALPFSAANRDGYAERTIAGAAVGASIDAVTADGLASALAYEALRDVMRGRSGLVPIPEADLMADEELALVVKAAHHFGHQIEVFAIIGAKSVNTVLARTVSTDADRPMWAVGAALTPRTARLNAVRDLVGQAQVRHFEGTDPDLGDPLLADLDPRTLPVTTTPASPEPSDDLDGTSIDAALTALHDQGRSALFVETTTADIRATGALVCGVVLLRRQERPAA